jgi:hypothetical protein
VSARRRLDRAAAAVLVGLAVLAGTGCTVGAEDPGATDVTAGSTGSAPTGAAAPRPSATERDRPGTAELSEQIFAAAQTDPEPVGSQTLQLPVENTQGTVTAPVTVDVLQVRRARDSTLVTWQISTTEDTLRMDTDALGSRVNAEFFEDVTLEDPAGGVRYRALSYRWGDFALTEIPATPVNACLCAYRASGFLIGPDPIVMDSLYPPLPAGTTTVTLAAPDGLSIPALPVSDADD